MFISSYRVYSGEEIPVTENCPRLLDVSMDKEFIENELYALPKARCEDYLKNESGTKNWKIVRPVISFSDKHLDIVVHSERDVLEMAEEGETMILPEASGQLTAGLKKSDFLPIEEGLKIELDKIKTEDVE